MLEEIRAALEALEQMQEAGVGAPGGVESMRARLRLAEQAPAGAGWAWLAERGDEAAALIVQYERSACRSASAGPAAVADGGRLGDGPGVAEGM